MIALSHDSLKPLIAEARLAPSVHNIQPSRWRLAGDAVELLGDPQRSIPAADPAGRDWRLSHGAALEGLSIALAARGLKLAHLHLEPPQPMSTTDPIRLIARMTIASLDQRPATAPTATRTTWRGTFRPTDPETDASLERLTAARDDLVLMRDPANIAHAATLGDRAGLFFLRDNAHRHELVSWLRLSTSNESYHRDGLNAEAMSMTAVEAWAAGLVLGPMFQTLDRIGLAAPLISEAAKTRSAAALALFHRPAGEDALTSGRAFYRAWLEFERQGLCACPISVLADWPPARNALTTQHAIPEERHIVSVFRIGRPAGAREIVHARLDVDELLIPVKAT